MTRNTTRRVEVACPVKAKPIRRKLLALFANMLTDTRRGWRMRSDGIYERLLG